MRWTPGSGFPHIRLTAGGSTLFLSLSESPNYFIPLEANTDRPPVPVRGGFCSGSWLACWDAAPGLPRCS